MRVRRTPSAVNLNSAFNLFVPQLALCASISTNDILFNFLNSTLTPTIIRISRPVDFTFFPNLQFLFRLSTPTSRYRQPARCSAISPADAQANADARVKEALDRLLSGENLRRRDPKIPYIGAEGVPIREEIVERRRRE